MTGATARRADPAKARKAGRRLAIKMLKEPGQNRMSDDHCIEAKYRGDGDQNNFALRYLEELRRANSAAMEAGFTEILTDYIGSIGRGSIPDPEYYDKAERQGELQ